MANRYTDSYEYIQNLHPFRSDLPAPKDDNQTKASNEKLVKLVMGRQSALENDKVNFTERMEEAAQTCAPHREDVRGNLAKGLKKGTKIYDGTAQGAAVLAADGIHGYHVSPAFPWFKYMMNRKQVNKIPEIREWLQEIEFNMYMALNRGNFYSEVWMWIYDGITLGSPPLYTEEDISQERISFESVHPGEIYISENRYGEVDILHRKRKLQARQLVQMFGKDKLPVQVQNSYKDAPFTEYEIIHAVFPREEYDDRKKDAKNKKFASVWLLSAGNHICRESGYDRFPYSVWRYMRSGKEPYAITPAMLAMADIQGVNIIAKTDLGSRQMALDPPLNVPSYMEGKVQWKPRGLNYYDKKGEIITPANPGANFPAVDETKRDIQNAIKERFHVDTYLMLNTMQAQGQRTAYEVSQLMAEKAAVLGAELGPLNRCLDDILDYVYDIEVAAGRMPSPPDILLELAHNDPALRFDPVYMGPLAQAQRERFAKDGIKKFLVEVGPLVQVDPTCLDNLNKDETFRYLADSDGVPEELLVDPAERDEIRAGRLKAQQEANQLEALQQGAQGMKTITEADKNMGGKLTPAIAQLMQGEAGNA